MPVGNDPQGPFSCNKRYAGCCLEYVSKYLPPWFPSLPSTLIALSTIIHSSFPFASSSPSSAKSESKYCLPVSLPYALTPPCTLPPFPFFPLSPPLQTYIPFSLFGAGRKKETENKVIFLATPKAPPFPQNSKSILEQTFNTNERPT